MPRGPVPSSPPAADTPADAADDAAVDRPSRSGSGNVAARAVVLTAAVDAACVLAFAAAGRSSHARDGGVVGVLGTAWPFLVGAAVGWVAVRAWREPGRPWPTGVVVAATAWLGGLALRAATGGGTAPAFVVVAGLVLGALLLGRRAVVTALSPAARRRRRER